jgi:hypothetical protein
MAHEFTTNHLQDSLVLFGTYRKLAEKAVEQVSDEEFFRAIDPEANSIAVIMRHMAGNMRSRWRDFLTTDGEKPDRNRDQEFELPIAATRERVMREWDEGWALVFGALEPLTEADLAKKVFIRGEPHSVTQAINRQIAHYASHVGQIILLAKHFRSKDWKTLSIPRGKSAEFNAQPGSKGYKL